MNLPIKYSFLRIDFLFSTLGILTGVLLIILYTLLPVIYFLVIGIPLIVGPIIYLIYRRREPTLSPFGDDKSKKRMLDIFYYITLGISLSALQLFENRDLVFFLMITLCIGILASRIVLMSRPFDIYVSILNILLISAVLKFSIYYFVGGMPGVDTIHHVSINSEFESGGSIEYLEDKEKSFPLWHIFVVACKLITFTGYKDASAISTTIPLIIASIFVFLIARKIFDEQVGLLAMLIFNVSDWHVFWGSGPATTSYGLILFCPMIFILINIINNKKVNTYLILLIIYTLVLLLSHAVSSFIYLVTIIGLYFGLSVYQTLYAEQSHPMSGLIISLTTVSLIGHWFYASYKDLSERSFLETIAYFLDDAVSSGYAKFLNRPEASAEFLSAAVPPLVELLLDKAGLMVLTGLTIIGCLFWLSNEYKSPILYGLCGALFGLAVMTYIFPLFGLRNLMPMRWFVFQYSIMSLASAFTLLHILKRTNKVYSRLLILFSVICILSFFMVGSNVSNRETPLWQKEFTTGTATTVSEESAMVTLPTFSAPMLVDYWYIPTMRYLGISPDQIELFNSEWQLEHNTEFQLQNRIFIWREYMRDRPIRVGYHDIEGLNVQKYGSSMVKNTVLGEPFYDKIERSYSNVYTNGEVSGYSI